jgi:RNA polymerase sigma factor (sigma-70 family)
VETEQEFLIKHRRLAIWAAKRAKASTYYQSISINDLIQEAWYGILFAYRTYDPNNIKRTKLSSWCAKHALWQISIAYGKAYHRDPVVGAFPLWSEDVIDKHYWLTEYEEQSERQAIAAKLTEAMRFVQEREATILRLLYGIETGDTYTLMEVGRIFKLTRERIRQIRDHGLRKLYNDKCMTVWREYSEYEQDQRERRVWQAMLARRSRINDESPRMWRRLPQANS